MTTEKLYKAIGDIKEQHILEAKQPKAKKPFSRVKVYALAACLCLVLGVASFSIVFLNFPGMSGGYNEWGDANTKLLEIHREDFSPTLDPAIAAQFENPDCLIKAYSLLSNQWYLSDKLEDFSQVVINEIFYVYPGYKDGSNMDTMYTHYNIGENGEIDSTYIAYPTITEEMPIPYGFWKLTYEIIDTALADIEYEDYIVTESHRLRTVFVWVRCETEDLILTYPTRPDFTGLEVGGIYTLEELQEILAEAHNQ